MLIEALFIIAPNWKIPRGSSTNECKKKKFDQSMPMILISNKKEWNTDTHNLDESPENYNE